MGNSGHVRIENEKILVLKNNIINVGLSPLIDPQITISLSPMRTLGGRPSKDTWSRQRSVYVSLHENGTRTDVEIIQYALVRCGPLFNPPQTFWPPKRLVSSNSHTHFPCAVVHAGRKFQVSAFSAFFAFFLVSIQSKRTTTPHLLNTAYLHATVIGTTPNAMQNEALHGSDFQFAALFFTSTSSISHHRLHPEQTFLVALSRHNSPTNSWLCFFSLSHHVYIWRHAGTKIQSEGCSTLCLLWM